jgi:hypothetical protein
MVQVRCHSVTVLPEQAFRKERPFSTFSAPEAGPPAGSPAQNLHKGAKTMRVHLSDSEAAVDLGTFLRDRVGAIVEQTEPLELEVSLLGSYNDAAMREELDAALRRWSLLRQQPRLLAAIEP